MRQQTTLCSRRNVLGGIGVVGSLGLAGCVGTGPQDENGDATETMAQGTESPQGEPEETATPQPMADEIEGWSWSIAADALIGTTEQYGEDRGGTVTINKIGNEALYDKYRSTLMSGTGAPTVSTLEEQDAASFIATNGLTDLSDRIERDGLADSFVAGKWTSVTKGEGIYALPWDLGPAGVFYRRDIYEDAGIDPGSIETWDDFIEEGKKLDDDHHMLNIPPTALIDDWRMQYRQQGAQAFTEDGRVNVHSEESVRVAANFRDIWDAGIATRMQAWSEGWYVALAEGTIASLPIGAWMEGFLKQIAPDSSGKWGVYPFPAFEKGGPNATNWGGSNLVISDQVSDAKKERGWDYVTYVLSSKEIQLGMYEEFGLFPSLKSAYDGDVFEAELEFFGGQKIRKTFVEAARDLPGYRYTKDTPEVENAITTYLDKVIKGDLSPEDGMRKAAEQVSNKTDRDLA